MQRKTGKGLVGQQAPEVLRAARPSFNGKRAFQQLLLIYRPKFHCCPCNYYLDRSSAPTYALLRNKLQRDQKRP